ncbi:hypothetical protein [Cobetia sp. UCD-24C]|uniref:hypothetical protein n=1 Tax=Cobetia sp. UCD-24C TaxID=1716176 RepID=UPI00128EACA7|nr:hypothetical protein [Cobetia sp. UCD-24C]
MDFLEDYMNINDNACFLCGSIHQSQITKEHVFPKWMLTKYNIWDKKLQLLNGTLLPYRQLLVPCCKNCNSGALATLEREISVSIEEGYKSASNLNHYQWYLWVGKIFYGILRKEVTLLKDRAKLDSGTIISNELLRAYSELHYFLQGVLGRHEFNNILPYSVLIVNVHGEDFFFRDNLYPGACLLKIGTIGLIVTFFDGENVSKFLNGLIKKIRKEKLNEIQFCELYVRCLDISARSSPLKYMHTKSIDDSMNLTYIFESPYVSEFNASNYLCVMNDVFKSLPYYNEEFFKTLPKDMIPSYIFNDKGGFNSNNPLL